MAPTKPLSCDKLYRKVDPRSFTFRTTAELEPLEDSFGQERAAEAVQFGIGIRHEGYNMFALGPTGMGKHNFVRRHLEQRAAKERVPSDWTYVNNFSEPHRPKVLRLPPGFGMKFRDEMAQLIDEVKAAIAAIFESDQYRARRETIETDFKERQEKAFNGIQERAQAKSISLIRTPMGLGLAPTKDGEVLVPEEFRKLDQPTQDKIRADIAELEAELGNVMRQAPQWQREYRGRLHALNREVTESAVRHPIDELRHRYQEMTQVLPYLTEVQEDIVENVDDFISSAQQQQTDSERPSPQEGPAPGALRRSLQGPPMLRRYQVNVIVDHRGETGAPIVYEDNPTYANLVGRIEQMAQFGALVTDFNLIKAGALHRANGGYLILDARKVLLQPSPGKS